MHVNAYPSIKISSILWRIIGSETSLSLKLDLDPKHFKLFPISCIYLFNTTIQFHFIFAWLFFFFCLIKAKSQPNRVHSVIYLHLYSVIYIQYMLYIPWGNKKHSRKKVCTIILEEIVFIGKKKGNANKAVAHCIV